MIKDKNCNFSDIPVLELEFIGIDDMGRPVYKDQNACLWKDIMLGEDEPQLCRSTNDYFDGEPDSLINCPYSFLNEPYVKNKDSFFYMFLDRLRQSIDFYIRNNQANPKVLYCNDVHKHLSEMKKIWNYLTDKPEWLTSKQLERYEELVNM